MTRSGSVRRTGRRLKGKARLLELPVLANLPMPGYRLPRLVVADKGGPFLRPNPLSDFVDDDVLSLNHLSGCAMQCAFCYARAYPRYAGDAMLTLYADAAERVRRELTQRSHLPRAVYLCPSTDPFPPILEVQEETARIVGVLADHGVEAWLMTRGFIRPSILEQLQPHADLIQVTFPLMTRNEKLRRILEPLAAPTRMRLRQAKDLLARGFQVRIALEPLIPGLTDTREHLVPLLDAVKALGLTAVSAAYLFLRPGIQRNLENQWGPLGLAEPVLDRYAEGPILPMGRIAAARHLPRSERQRGYALLMALAAERDMTVHISALTNPDFTIATPAIQHDRPLRQMQLGQGRSWAD
jgi:DNA repair photolyase